MNVRLTATALALALSGVMLAGCTERPTEPPGAMPPRAEIGPLGVAGVSAEIQHEDVPLLYTGDALSLTGDYTDVYDPRRPAVSWTWAVESPEDAQYSFSNPASQTTTFTATDPADYILTLVVCVQGETDPEPECSRPAIDPEFDPALILVHAVTNQPPVASITVEGENTTVQVGDVVWFNAYGSKDPEGGLLSYSWNLGEGWFPYAERTSHTYTEPGDYTVQLEVRDERDESNRAEVSITVTQPGPEAAIQDLMNDVQALVTGGTLSQDRADGLLMKLSAALTSLNNDLSTDACKQLKAFVNQVKATVKAKKLPSATGQALIASAEEIRTQIGCT